MAVLPIYNTLVVPDTVVYFKEDYYRLYSGRAPLEGDKVTMIVAKENQDRDEMTADSFYPIGIAGVITQVNSSNEVVAIHTRNRVNIEEVVVYHDHSIDLTISKREDIQDLDHEVAAQKLKAVKSASIKYLENQQWGSTVRGYVTSWNSLGDAAAALSPWMVNSNKEKYDILAEDSLAKRTDMLEKIIYENLEMIQVNNEAKSAQEEDYQKIYRESAIRKQLEYLQKELDDMHPEEVSDLRKFEIKIQESDMNPDARKEAEKVLNRLKQEGQNSAESGMLYDYLDFVTELPWGKAQPEHISLDEAKRILDEDHYGLEKVKKRIIQQLAVLSLKKEQSGSILCFVGAPGTGKTSIGQSIARALHRKYVRVSLGGVRDEADIRGHRRTYIGAMPGRIMDGIAKAGVTNPVMVLDEIDKLSSSYNGDPASALLEVLDPEQNFSFTDHYMNVPYDLSDVFFICTANTLDTIPEPLLNRMEVIQFQGYTPTEKFQIARRHLLPKAEADAGIPADKLEITDEALDTLISDYTREAGVRGLKKRLDSICRSAAVELVGEGEKQAGENCANPAASVKVEDAVQNGADAPEAPKAPQEESAEGESAAPAGTDSQVSPKEPAEGEGTTENGADAPEAPAETAESEEAAPAGTDTPETSNEAGNTDIQAVDMSKAETVVITPDNLRDYMEFNPIPRRHVKDKAKPGIVTGLAWTQVGGTILYIETMFTKGSGKLTVTGQLGDVMKESAQIAISLVKYLYPDKEEMFEKNDLHIHVPDGSTPKDGPSAGITLTTALASLVTGIPVTPEVAMTGEVSLQGGVNAIGGLPEKLMAAQRAGVKKVFIPKDNIDDLRDVAEEVKQQLEIVPVATVEDVLGQLGLLKKPETEETK